MKAKKTKLKEINRKISSSRAFYDRLNYKAFMLDAIDFDVHKNTRHIVMKGDSGAPLPKVKTLSMSVRLQEIIDRLNASGELDD